MAITTLQVNLNRLKLFEVYSQSRQTYQLENPTLNTETIISPYRSQSLIPVPNNFNRGIVPDTLSVLVCYSYKAANASKNSTIGCIKLFECKNRTLVYQNIELYRGLRGGMMEYTKLLVATHEDAILAAISPGSKIIGIIGTVLLFSPSRGYYEGPPGYCGQNRSFGSQLPGNPPYPSVHSSNHAQNCPPYVDHNLYPPFMQTINSNFRPLDPPPLDYIQPQAYPSFPPPGYSENPQSNSFQTSTQSRPDYRITHFPYPEITNPNMPPRVENNLEDVLLEF